ncbi:MAG: hypothetical protein NTU95_03425 [Methanothrix sp.]|nr:hypothetical protein [Methanothrix sp.]
MKRVIVILFMVAAAAALLQAEASSKSDSTGPLGLDGSVFFTPGTDSKKVEDKITEALVRLDSWTRERAEKRLGNFALNNSTAVNSTVGINSSLCNSSLLNSSAAQVNGANEDRLNIGSSSKGSFNGYYGMTASRHENGKSGIDSRMFLSGTFEMDKTVKFQDQGI